MAEIVPTITAAGRGDGSTILAVWALVLAADTCRPVSFPECADKSVQVEGTFDSASISVHGSNAGTTYRPLNDPGGTVIGISTANIKAILENTNFVKPVTAGGGGSSSLTISILFHLTNPLRN